MKIHAFASLKCGCGLFCLPDNCIDPAPLKTQEWLFPETTVNFEEMPLQYNGFCGYTLVNRDGLLLPGIISVLWFLA